MGKSQQTYGKSEREKKSKKKREDKKKRKEERRANSKKGTGFDNMLAYVDEYGQLTDTPPDPSKTIIIDAESIVIGIPKKVAGEEQESNFKRQGKVSFFDSSKGFGFIIDSGSQEKFFVHVSGLIDEIAENDLVEFELEKGMKGMNAVRVKKVS